MAQLPGTTSTDRPTDGGICFCCRRQDSGVGYFKQGTPHRIVWSCDAHIPFIRKAVAMSQSEFTIYEKRAVAEAGAVAGQKLVMEFGRTDLAQLTPDEWLQFCETLIRAFGDDLARRLSDTSETPF